MGMSPNEIALALNETGLLSKKDAAAYLKGSTRGQLVTRSFPLPLPTSGDKEKLREFETM